MQALNKWIALTVAAVLVIVAAGWLVLVSPKRSQAATTFEQVAAQRTANAAQQVELQVLQDKAADLPRKRAALDAVAAKIPAGAQLPELVRALTTAAATSGVDLVSVTPGAPAAAVAQAPVAPAAPAGAAAPAPAAPAPAAPAAPAPAAPAAPAPGAPAAGALLEIPVTLNVVGDYFAVARFLGRIEELPRALRVSDLTLAPGTGPAKPGSAAAPTAPGSPRLTSTITGSVFMTPGPAAAPAASPSAAQTR